MLIKYDGDEGGFNEKPNGETGKDMGREGYITKREPSDSPFTLLRFNF